MSSISPIVNTVYEMDRTKNMKLFKEHMEKGDAIMPKDHHGSHKPLMVTMKKGHDVFNRFNTLDQTGSQAGNEMINKIKYGM
jgi:hypothetical protein